MHTGESLYRVFEQLLRSKPLPVNGWDFVQKHCSRVECIARAGMTRGIHENREAGPDDHRWSIRCDARDSHPKQNRDAIRGAIHILLRDRFNISMKDIPAEALTELELRLEQLMPGDGEYVPFAEQCGATPLLALAPRRLPSVASVRPKHPSERSLERCALTITQFHGELGANLRYEILRYGQ
jgi:hypothetical protein